MNAIRQLLAKKIEKLTPSGFEALALEVFRYQAQYNSLYANYLQLLNIQPKNVTKVENIPFLPIQFFKNHIIKTGEWTAQTVFTSSGTTERTTSKHWVRDLDFYLQNTKKGFEYFFGNLKKYCIIALLPAYLERSNSSLVAMADYFIRSSNHAESGFFLYNTDELVKLLKVVKQYQTPTILLGVTFALLDLAEQYPMDLNGIMIMETGGMKGRRRELIRDEVHQILGEAFNVSPIYSEYGMTELFSQAYAINNGKFQSSPTLRVFGRQVNDPLSPEHNGKTAALNFIDLANLDTISFIATDDIGKINNVNSYEVHGRLDASDLRGCNLMVQ
ncbi:MAG: acyl transferase [Saprospiraceae bacterium]|nr:acyl transferase [Saprospiraceae bacterium]